MRYFDQDDAARLNAEPWQLALLSANPSYCSWGPHEDYMWHEGEGWNSRVIIPTWSEFGWQLDDMNECVNFYFEVTRESEECPSCSGNGYHPEAQKIVRTFYRHSCEPGETPWSDAITDDEAAALVAEGRGRLDKLTTAEDFNAAQRAGGLGGHDAINRHILIPARCARLDIPTTCPACDGHGYVFIAPAARVALVLWWLHPRKGCSRGIEITTIEQSEIAAVAEFLAEAARRNAERFAGIALLAPTDKAAGQ